MKPPRLVLLRPRNADNLGAIARAMKNFGLSDWVVVSPNPEILEAPGMHRLAVKSGDLLESVRRVESLDEALAGCTWVVGTTMRSLEGRRRLVPAELAAQAAARNDDVWALVFGDERSGMTNEDLQRCHDVSFIPSSDEQPSLNLSQAVVVYGYALAAHARGAAPSPGPALADDGAYQALRSALQAGLTAANFLQHDGRHAVDDLLTTLQRSRLTKKEAGLWTAVMRSVAKAGKVAGS